MSTHTRTATAAPCQPPAPRYWADLAYTPASRPLYPFARGDGAAPVAVAPRPTEAERAVLERRECERRAWWAYQVALYSDDNSGGGGRRGAGEKGAGQDEGEEKRGGKEEEGAAAAAWCAGVKPKTRGIWLRAACFCVNVVRCFKKNMGWKIWFVSESLRWLVWWTAILFLLSVGSFCVMEAMIWSKYVRYERAMYELQYAVVPCFRSWTGAHNDRRLFYTSCG
jgi:hypothetical protein